MKYIKRWHTPFEFTASPWLKRRRIKKVEEEEKKALIEKLFPFE